ncbi:MAG: hypothetical protein H7X77_00710, partial [Anaerolineae bacterium]|nr:hypothetical protein [Anaerolineae bacterium]
MSHFSKLGQWVMVGVLLGVFLFTPLANPVQAAVACLNTIPVATGDGNDFSDSSDVLLSGNSLVWSKHTGELFHYNLDTLVISVIGLRKEAYYGDKYLAVDDNHIAWIDPANQVQLYTISSATTLQLTDDTRLKADVQVEGNYVLWRQGKNLNKIKKLQLYDIAAATTTQLAKTFSYSLNEGRILWEGNLYDLASATTSFLGEAYLTVLHGSYALGSYYVYPVPENSNYVAWQLAIKDLNTGILTQITDNPFGDFIDYFAIDGDYVSWSEHYGLGESAVLFLYQISTGKTQLILPPGENAGDRVMKINGRFVGFTDYYPENENFNFVIYDTVSGSRTPIFDDPEAFAALGDLDEERIAWMEFKDNAMRVLLRTDCGSTPTLVDQTPNLNILTGRSINLSVTTTGDQPITYQWYQGALGDTTTPVGDNTTSFITPPLTETT